MSRTSEINLCGVETCRTHDHPLGVSRCIESFHYQPVAHRARGRHVYARQQGQAAVELARVWPRATVRGLQQITFFPLSFFLLGSLHLRTTNEPDCFLVQGACGGGGGEGGEGG